MFNVTKTELKKMVSRPGIYILSVLLAIILVVGIFIYKPNNYKLSSATLVGKNYQEKLAYFNNGDKKKIDDAIDKTTNAFTLYDQSVSYKKRIDDESRALTSSYSELKKSRILGDDFDYRNSIRIEVLSNLETLNNTITEGINNAQNGSYNIVTTKANYEQYEKKYATLKEYFSLEITTDETLNKIISVYDKEKSSFFSAINNFYYPTINDETQKSFTKNEKGTNLYTVLNRLNSIEYQISKLTNEINTNTSNLSSQEQTDKLTKLANEYIWTGETYNNLAKYTLISSVFDEVENIDEMKLLYLTDYDEYNTNSNLIKYDYLFKNNKFESSYANPLTIGTSSNQETNAYDYAYFAMKLFGFIIIIYSIIHACATISGEQKDGTLRYFAMRPVKRSELLFGKFFATVIMSLILIIFSGIISLLVGGAVFGFKSADIFTVFNSNSALVIKPIAMIIINMFSLFVELMVYVSIAYLLSCLIKSDLLNVTLVIVFLLINTLMPAFVVGAKSWLAYYPFSHMSLYALYGSNLYANSNNFFNLVFGAKVYATTSIVLTVTIPLLIILICLIVASVVFKRKEL
ncbi:MAG: ABC transporter permease subunit [Clostridia bacterium]|nr:ABC transporter permease subunit [Clostridia bacterium]